MILTCKQLIEFLDDYIDGALPEEERRTFEEHLSCCPPCVTYLRTYRETIHIAKRCLCEKSTDVPGDVPESLVRAILDARKRR